MSRGFPHSHGLSTIDFQGEALGQILCENLFQYSQLFTGYINRFDQVEVAPELVEEPSAENARGRDVVTRRRCIGSELHAISYRLTVK